MSFRTQALATFRRRNQGLNPEAPLPAVFLMEPTMSITAAVTASWCPVSSVQTLGATERSGIAGHVIHRDAGGLTWESVAPMNAELAA